MDLRLLLRPPYPASRSSREPAEGDLVPDGITEKKHLLWNEAQMGAKMLKRDLPDRDIIDQDLAFRHIVNATIDSASVFFPQPVCPTTAKVPPAGIWKEIRSNARIPVSG